MRTIASIGPGHIEFSACASEGYPEGEISIDFDLYLPELIKHNLWRKFDDGEMEEWLEFFDDLASHPQLKVLLRNKAKKMRKQEWMVENESTQIS